MSEQIALVDELRAMSSFYSPSGGGNLAGEEMTNAELGVLAGLLSRAADRVQQLTAQLATVRTDTARAACLVLTDHWPNGNIGGVYPVQSFYEDVLAYQQQRTQEKTT